MSSKFDKVPLEQDTEVTFQQEAKFGEYDVLYQKWAWSGVTAESLIFANEDITEIDEKGLVAEVESSPLVNQGSEITFKRSDSGFTFVNFNFKTN